VIGSVHYLGWLSDGTMWTVDGPAAELRAGIDQSFGGKTRAAVEAFYRRVADMALSDRPDIVGHLDLVKKNNGDSQDLFDEESSWYREALASAIEAVASAGCVVEVNTGGVSRGFRSDWYPCKWALRRMRELDVPVTFGSDAHDPRHVGFQMREVREFLQDVGYRSLWFQGANGWAECPLATGEGG
jgi:histidinol-phosphatase (PHP family)